MVTKAAVLIWWKCFPYIKGVFCYAKKYKKLKKNIMPNLKIQKITGWNDVIWTRCIHRFTLTQPIRQRLHRQSKVTQAHIFFKFNFYILNLGDQFQNLSKLLYRPKFVKYLFYLKRDIATLKSVEQCIFYVSAKKH